MRNLAFQIVPLGGTKQFKSSLKTITYESDKLQVLLKLFPKNFMFGDWLKIKINNHIWPITGAVFNTVSSSFAQLGGILNWR